MRFENRALKSLPLETMSSLRYRPEISLPSSSAWHPLVLTFHTGAATIKRQP